MLHEHTRGLRSQTPTHSSLNSYDFQEKGVADIPNTGHYVKADRHSVVDSWVFEQNVNNKLVVDKSKSLSLQPNSKLVDPNPIRSPARSKATGVSRGLPNKLSLSVSTSAADAANQVRARVVYSCQL